MDKCDNCTLVLSTNILRIGNCVDCNVSVYSPMQPILYGDNRGLTLGPLNVYYREMVGHIEAAGIPSS